jgi:hypothetical protein
MVDGGGHGEEATVQEPTNVDLFEDLVNHVDEDDVVYGSPKWLENFREMKQAALDPLYEDGGKCLKDCTALRFYLHMLMLKARHGWSDTSFNELLSYLATMYPTGSNKVQANTYRAKKLIRPVAMKLRKFDACPNHCILYRMGTKYETLTSCSHYGYSRYKRNAGYHVGADNDEALWGGSKKKKGAKKSATAKCISAQQDEEEEGYARRKSPALSVWYLPMTDRLRALFGNLEDAKLLSWHASADRKKDDGMLHHPSDGQQWKDFDQAHLNFGKEPRNIWFCTEYQWNEPFQ